MNFQEPFGRLFYGPSDFIFDSEYITSHVPNNHCQQQQQHYRQTHHTRTHDNYDTRSVISEPPISRSVVYRETSADAPGTVIRKYKTTKTTTTTHHAPNGYVYTTQQHQVNGVPVLKPINIEQQEQSQQQAKSRSSSIPASTRRHFINTSQQNVSVPSETSRYYSTRTTSNKSQYNKNSMQQQQQQQQQQFIAPISPQISVRAASTPRMVNEEIYHRTMNNQQQSSKTYKDNLAHQQHQQQQRSFNNTSSRTLPVNYRQTNNDSFNNTTFAYSPTSSCIDYSNTHYNSDWAMRHGYLEPVNQQKLKEQKLNIK